MTRKTGFPWDDWRNDPREETAEGIYTLSAQNVNDNKPVAWICHGAKITGTQGSESWNESWVFHKAKYVTPDPDTSRSYKFKYVESELTQQVINQYAMNAMDFANWVRSQYQETANVTLQCDMHSVHRQTSTPS